MSLWHTVRAWWEDRDKQHEFTPPDQDWVGGEWVETPQGVIFRGGALTVAHQAWSVQTWPSRLTGDQLVQILGPLRPGAWPLVTWFWRTEPNGLVLNGDLERKIRRLEWAVRDRGTTELGPRREEWMTLQGLRLLRDRVIFAADTLVTMDGVVVVTSTPDALAEDVAMIKARWESLGVQVAPLTWEQMQALRRIWHGGVGNSSDAPAGWMRWISESPSSTPWWNPRIVPADRVAQMIWPGWGHVSDDPERGIYVGHTPQNQPVFCDFYQDVSGLAANLLVVGATGNGKSFWLKTLVQGWLAQGWGLVIFDVDGEYAALCDAIGGTWIDLSDTQAGTLPNPFALPPRTGHPPTDRFRMPMMLRTASTLLRMLGGWDARTDATVQQAILQVWAARGALLDDPATWDDAGPTPTMAEVWDALTNHDSPAAQDALTRLWTYWRGADQQVLGNATGEWPTMPGSLVVWHLGNIGTQGGWGQADLPPATAARYWLIMQTTWGWLRIRKMRGDWTVILADEGQRLLSQSVLGPAIVDLATTIRKWNGALALATNQPQALWDTPTGQGMWNACPMKAFLKLESQQVQAVTQALHMPQRVADALTVLPAQQILFRMRDGQWDAWTQVHAKVPPEEERWYRTRGRRVTDGGL
ncbi:VirB4 family type IV secretion system protein [Sulfobacillus thermosulfidooxidans]|uniref:VirB4 family type IV secretion system protein n=1 Tax=Sulfobacillus thermosulfidooxidans TaxID=28034 RepID=UPI0006B6550A|nr:DUF87 domain-containing protein [Sulfobacillus thermosulfidooxidans]